MTKLVVPHSRPWLEQGDADAVSGTLVSGMVACGAGVEAFEKAIATYVGLDGGLACASGTAALVLALKTLSVGPGDEVILPTYVCWNVLAAVSSVGATACICDVNEYGVLTRETVQRVINHRTRAVIAVHIFGHPCDVSSLHVFDIPIIEDACQAFGLEVNGRYAGTLGTIGVYSFHATKCLTTGEGGMIVSSDPQWHSKARHLLHSPVQLGAAGLGAMSDLQATLGIAQISRYSAFLDRRRQLLVRYGDLASCLFHAKPGYPPDVTFLYRYTLRSKKTFVATQQEFFRLGIHIRRGVDGLLHRRLGLSDREYPVATEIFEQTVSLPYYPALTPAECDRVLSATREIFGGA